MGEAWHVAVLIVGHGGSRHRSGSWGAPWLAAAGTASPTALAALSFVEEGCGHHIRSLLLFFRLLVLFRFPVFWMAEAFNDSRASSSAAA
jgi:hypothetical protein